MVITDIGLAGGNLMSLLKKACESGVRCIQIREKILSDAELLLLCKQIKNIALKSHAYVLINDRLDIALLSNSDGIHSSSNGIKAKDIKKQSSKMITGKSVHSISQAKEAERDGFDYILFGPVFRTPSKVRYGNPQGLEKLSRICNSVKIPVFAVGGITPLRAEKCLEAGASGVAAIRPFMTSGNIKKIIKDFESSLGSL